jgi:MFS family permease
LLVLLCGLGPHHARAPRFSTRAVALAWSNRRIRLTYLGYFGHMWELYAMWAWVGAAAAVSYGALLGEAEATRLAKLTAFLAIALGGLTCAPAGWVADRIGKAQVTIIAMALSGSAAIATAVTFGGPIWLTFVLIIIWGIFVIPDSAQFSALVADASPPDLAGSVMTLQTALGFALTAVTVQVTPLLANAFGWPAVLAGLALGPIVGIAAMLRLLKI